MKIAGTIITVVVATLTFLSLHALTGDYYGLYNRHRTHHAHHHSHHWWW